MKIKPVASVGRIVLFAIVLITGPAFSQSSLSQKSDSSKFIADFEAMNARGEALYKTGRTFIWSGMALIPLGLLALVPVAYDGAFGITAADPGIGGSILGAAAGLIHLGIPIMGSGTRKEEAAAKGLHPDFEAAPSGWPAYKQSWKWIGAGGALIATSFPFVIVAALDSDNQRSGIGWLAGSLLYGGLTVGGIGILEQYYSGYLFSRGHAQARSSLLESVSVTLQPILRLGARGSETAGLRLNAVF